MILSVIHLTVCPMCWSSQLAARLDLVHDHPRFAPSSGLAGSTQTFFPEQSSSFTPHIQDLSAILDPHDHFLSSQHPPQDDDFPFVLEEAVKSLHIQQEVAAALLLEAAPPLETSVLFGMRPKLFPLLPHQTVLYCHPQGRGGL